MGAIDTLREALDDYLADPEFPQVAAALAVVEALLQAAEAHLLHTDFCGDEPACATHASLAAAVRRVKGDTA